jgi:hypothetical protein
MLSDQHIQTAVLRFRDCFEGGYERSLSVSSPFYCALHREVKHSATTIRISSTSGPCIRAGMHRPVQAGINGAGGQLRAI